MKYFALASIVLVGFIGQVTKGEKDKVRFHVTTVEQGEATDYCTTGKCSATRFTVEGYTTPDKDASIQYVLDCVETIMVEPNSSTSNVLCARVHSHNDYMVEVGAEFIFFDSYPSDRKGLQIAYNIKSEKEVKKK